VKGKNERVKRLSGGAGNWEGEKRRLTVFSRQPARSIYIKKKEVVG